MSRFIETIKVEDQKIYLLPFHQKRMNETFLHFGKPSCLDINNIFKSLQHDEDGLFKFRVIYDLEGNYTTRMIPYAVSEIHNFQLVVDNNIDYSFKYEDRKIFEKLIAKSNSSEIIIVKNNQITDTSFTNILFKKGKEWFTPKSFLLNGVQRQHLIEAQKIKEVEINLYNIKEFSHFQLINAMIDMDDTFIYPIENIINLRNHTYDDEI